MIALLADAAPDLRAELASTLVILVLAVVKWWAARQDAKEAASKANTEAERAEAAKKAQEAAAAQAAATQKGLDALALFIESQKRKQASVQGEAAAKQTSAAIRAFTEALPGAEAVVAATVQRLGLSSKSREAVQAFRADGLPDLGMRP